MSLRSYDNSHSRLRVVVMLTVVFQPYMALASSPVALPRGLAAESTSTQVADIALQRSGVLQGQVVNAAGTGEANVVVKLTRGRDTWQVNTDTRGWFRLTELRGGAYQFQVGGQDQLIRAWAPGTAPPNANPGILVTPSTDIVRGQHAVSPNTNQYFRVLKQRLANPLILTGVTLTVVAIPVALHNSDDDDPPATP
ncbi:MAG: carboxypeptidase-like regulatory domain-containing protein [Bythopirellula sp.]